MIDSDEPSSASSFAEMCRLLEVVGEDDEDGRDLCVEDFGR